MCDTVQSLVGRCNHKNYNKDKAIAVSVDLSANYCKAFPVNGGSKSFVKIGEI